MTTTADNAQAALDLIHRNGWAQGVQAQIGTYSETCLALAIAQTVVSDTQNTELMSAAGAVIRANYPERLTRNWHSASNVCIDFNDHQDTTLADIETVLGKVATT